MPIISMLSTAPAGPAIGAHDARAIFANSGRSRPNPIAAIATSPIIVLANSVHPPCELISATTNASMIHASASAMAADASESWPSGVRVNAAP